MAAQPEWFVLEMRQLRFYTEDREDRAQPHLQQLPSELPKIVSCILCSYNINTRTRHSSMVAAWHWTLDLPSWCRHQASCSSGALKT